MGIRELNSKSNRQIFSNYRNHILIGLGVSLLLISSITLFPIQSTYGVPPTQKIVTNINGHLVVFSQFLLAFPDECPSVHFHAASGGKVTALDGTEIADPLPAFCGFFIPRFFLVDIIPNDMDFDGVPDALEVVLGTNKNNPDSDANGVLDGDEDFDNDGLSNHSEINIHGTDPKKPDSNNNGIPDSIEIFLETTAKDFTKIPVVINILKSSGASVDHAKEAVKKANVILKDAKIMLFLAKQPNVLTVNDGDDGSGGGTAGDGKLTDAEFRKVQAAGGMEINTLPGGKGAKITFANPDNGVYIPIPGTPGASIHRVPTIVVEQRGTTDLTGGTIAHEFGHVFTLSGHPNAGDGDPNNDSAGNVMRPSSSGRDDFINSDDADKGLENVGFSDKQKETIAMDMVAKNMGYQGTMQSVGHLREFQGGNVVDALGDQIGVEVYRDLNWISLSSEVGNDIIHGWITLYDMYPNSPVDISYSLLFDADDNTLTGIPVGSFSGIDKQAIIQVKGDLSTGPLTVNGYVIDWISGLDSPILNLRLVLFTLEAGEDVPGIPKQHQLEFDLIKSALGLTAADVPVGVTSQTSDTPFAPTIFDEASLVFDTDLHLNFPTLTVDKEFAVSGQTISYTIAGLTVFTPFDLLVDDTIVVSGTTDGSGGSGGSFAFPTLPSDFYFLTAHDTTGAFAFNALEQPTPCPTPQFDDMVITFDCVVTKDFTAPANVLVKINSVMTIPNGVTLDINFATKNLTIESGSSVLIISGGKIT